MIGLLDARRRPTVSDMASGCGPAGYEGGDSSDPQEILLFCTGENKISIGKSISTGPGAPEVAVRYAWDTSRGISSTSTTR